MIKFIGKSWIFHGIDSSSGYSCNNRPEILVLYRQTVFQGYFRRLNCARLHFGILIDDLPRDKLTACSILYARAKDPAIRMVEMAFLRIFFSHHGPRYEYPSVNIKNGYLYLFYFS